MASCIEGVFLYNNHIRLAVTSCESPNKGSYLVNPNSLLYPLYNLMNNQEFIASFEEVVETMLNLVTKKNADYG